MTDPIKAKIIEAVPELFYCSRCGHMGSGHKPQRGKFPCTDEFYWNTQRPITLADVLRAIAKNIHNIHPIYFVADGGGFWVETFEDEKTEFHFTGIEWNLAKDYDGQSDEVKAFIGKLLGV